MPIHTAEMWKNGLVLGDRMDVVARTNSSGMDPNVEPDEKKWLTGIWSMDYYILIFCENIAPKQTQSKGQKDIWTDMLINWKVKLWLSRDTVTLQGRTRHSSLVQPSEEYRHKTETEGEKKSD